MALLLLSSADLFQSAAPSVCMSEFIGEAHLSPLELNVSAFFFASHFFCVNSCAQWTEEDAQLNSSFLLEQNKHKQEENRYFCCHL